MPLSVMAHVEMFPYGSHTVQREPAWGDEARRRVRKLRHACIIHA